MCIYLRTIKNKQMEKYFKNKIKAQVKESHPYEEWDDVTVTIEWSLTPVFSNSGFSYWIVNVQRVGGTFEIERPPFKRCSITGASEGITEEYDLENFNFKIEVEDDKTTSLQSAEINLTNKTITINF
jgi:hypothetical protein